MIPFDVTRGRSQIRMTGELLDSTSRGSLAGDILWLATIAFAFAVITGIVG